MEKLLNIPDRWLIGIAAAAITAILFTCGIAMHSDFERASNDKAERIATAKLLDMRERAPERIIVVRIPSEPLSRNGF